MYIGVKAWSERLTYKPGTLINASSRSRAPVRRKSVEVITVVIAAARFRGVGLPEAISVTSILPNSAREISHRLFSTSAAAEEVIKEASVSSFRRLIQSLSLPDTNSIVSATASKHHLLLNASIRSHQKKST